jgi:hypothetical protein
MTGMGAILERARFAGPVAGHVDAVGDFVAAATDHLPAVGEVPGVGLVGGEDPVLGIQHDARLRQVFQVGG